MTAQLTTREERGQAIAKLEGQIKRIDEDFYLVKSQSGDGEYAVTKVCARAHEFIKMHIIMSGIRLKRDGQNTSTK